MIDLSHKAAKRFCINWKDLDERSGDFWKVDAVMIGRAPMLFVVHEYTLFTLVRRKAAFRSGDPLRRWKTMYGGKRPGSDPWFTRERKN